MHEPGLTAWQAQPHVRAAQKRTVTLLATVQATGAVGVGVSSALGSLLVESVTGSAAGAGLARTAVTLGAAAAALPLALLARRAGRRLALSAGWITATAGAVVLVLAAAIRSLPLMLAVMVLFGANSASNLQGRYAAADLARPGNRARALSVVVWSTTIGAVIGPNLAAPGATVASALHLPELAGAFVLAAACQFLAAALLWLWLRPDPLLLAQQYQNQGAAQASTQVRQQGSRRDGIAAVRAHLIRTPRALFAFTAIVVAHTAMSAVMAMTPVSMAADGMTLTIVGVTISIHIAGMYAFSPAVGWLADRIGHLPATLTGQAILVASAVLSGLSNGSMGMIMTSLFLLGLGWSFSLIAGSALLNDTTPAILRPAMQGASDTTMNIVAALGAGLAGPVMALFGFTGLNAAAVMPVALVLLLAAIAARTRTENTSTPAPE